MEEAKGSPQSYPGRRVQIRTGNCDGVEDCSCCCSRSGRGETCEKDGDGMLRVRTRVVKTQVDSAFLPLVSIIMIIPREASVQLDGRGTVGPWGGLLGDQTVDSRPQNWVSCPAVLGYDLAFHSSCPCSTRLPFSSCAPFCCGIVCFFLLFPSTAKIRILDRCRPI